MPAAHLEISMCNNVAHLVGERQRQLRMVAGELGIALFNVVAGLADDLKVPNHGILYE